MPRSRSAGWLAWRFMLLVVLLVLAGCAGDDSAGGGGGAVSRNPSVHREGGGALSLSSAKGGMATYRPSGLATGEPWFGYFGTMLPCTKANRPVTVTRIRAVGAADSQVSYLLHQVSSDVVRAAPPASRKDFTPTDNWDTRREFGVREKPGDDAPNGTYRGLELPITVAQRCRAARDAFRALSRQRVPKTDFYELVVRLRSGDAGVQVKHLLVDYTDADGKRHTLRTDWELTACGTNTPEDVCDSG